jgi:Ca2+-binding RTX toxin-like protein
LGKNKTQRSAATVEPLEGRLLLSSTGKVVLKGATLRITAASSGSAIFVTTADAGQTIRVAFGSGTPISFPKQSIASILIGGSRTQDRITVREEAGRIDLPLIIRSQGGSDYIDLDKSPGRIAAGDGSDTVLGSSGDDQIDGGKGSDNLFGGDGNDSIKGGNNGDDIRGDDGDDTLVGESGNDILDGGFGSDVLKGSSGNNQLTDYAREGEVNIFYGSFRQKSGGNIIFGTNTDSYYSIDFYYDKLYFKDPLPFADGDPA